MTDSSDPMENQSNESVSRDLESVAGRLWRRKSAAGVALPQIRRRLSRITRASSRIRKKRLVLPGNTQRERIKNFNATLKQKQANGPRIGSRTSKNRQRASWEQLEMLLPNGAPSESSRSNVLRAGLNDLGMPSGGQVIPPFSPPASTNEPSFIERRQARLSAQEPKKTAADRKKPDPSLRLFSRVEEIKPSGDEMVGGVSEKPPIKDPSPQKSQTEPIKPEKKDQPAPNQTTIKPGKSSTVQREMARETASPQPIPLKDSLPELRNEPEAQKQSRPGDPQEQTNADLNTFAPLKSAEKPAAEAQQLPLAKKPGSQFSRSSRQRTEEPHEVKPGQPAPPTEKPSEVKAQQITPFPVKPHEDKPGQPIHPTEKPSEVKSQQTRPLPQKPHEPKPGLVQPSHSPVAPNVSESSPQSGDRSPLADPKPSAATVPSSSIQREPQRAENIPAAPQPAAPQMDTKDQPLDLPLAPRKSPDRQDENLDSGKSDLKRDTEEQSHPVDLRDSSPRQSLPPLEKPALLTENPTGQIPEKSSKEPSLEKTPEFRPLLLRQKRQLKAMKPIGFRSVLRMPFYSSKKNIAHSKPNLIQRQAVRHASPAKFQQTKPAIERAQPQQIVEGSPKTESLTVRPQGQQPNLAQSQNIHSPRVAARTLPPRINTRPPLRLSLRPLTASQTRPEITSLPQQIPEHTAAEIRKPTAKKTGGVRRLPLLLSQRSQSTHISPGKPAQQLMPGASPSPTSSPVTKIRAARSGFGPSFSPPDVRQPRGEKMLVTHHGRQMIQRQIQQSSHGQAAQPTADARQKQSEASYQGQTIINTSVMPIRHPQKVTPPQQTEQKHKVTSKQRAKKRTAIFNPAQSEPTRSPVNELPVVHPIKATPTEHVIQREMDVPGPVAQRAISESAQVDSSQTTETEDRGLDLGRLARDVYPIIKRMIAVEKERSSGRLY